MSEIIVYKVALAGEVRVQATNDDDAKQQALDYFALAPLDYLVIKDRVTVIVPEP